MVSRTSPILSCQEPMLHDSDLPYALEELTSGKHWHEIVSALPASKIISDCHALCDDSWVTRMTLSHVVLFDQGHGLTG